MNESCKPIKKYKNRNMAKRQHGNLSGTTYQNRKVSIPTPHFNVTSAQSQYLAMAANYFWTAYATLNGNYVALVTVFLIVLLSFILPDISQKIHRTNELKAMKKVLHTMSKEVNRVETACLTVADEICSLHCSVRDDTTETFQDKQDLSVCTSGLRTTQSAPAQVEKKIGFFRRIFFPRRNTSRKEITIMSYLYTDSFDADKSPNDSNSIDSELNDSN